MSCPQDSMPTADFHYGRLFGGPFAGHAEADLRDLAAEMKEVPQNRRGRRRQGDVAPSVFVYLGQFLAHDLTHDETRLENAARQSPVQTRNRHSPRLNLESVYGGGPQRSPELYDFRHRGAETFLVGRTKALPKKGIGSTQDDLFRSDGKAVLADRRNTQHLIIAQLHLVFLKFHNRLVDLLTRSKSAGLALPGETIFAAARRLCVWHYQWIVRNEFLRWFALPEVLADIERNGRLFFSPSAQPP